MKDIVEPWRVAVNNKQKSKTLRHIFDKIINSLTEESSPLLGKFKVYFIPSKGKRQAGIEEYMEQSKEKLFLICSSVEGLKITNDAQDEERIKNLLADNIYRELEINNGKISLSNSLSTAIKIKTLLEGRVPHGAANAFKDIGLLQSIYSSTKTVINEGNKALHVTSEFDEHAEAITTKNKKSAKLLVSSYMGTKRFKRLVEGGGSTSCSVLKQYSDAASAVLAQSVILVTSSDAVVDIKEMKQLYRAVTRMGFSTEESRRLTNFRLKLKVAATVHVKRGDNTLGLRPENQYNRHSFVTIPQARKILSANLPTVKPSGKTVRMGMDGEMVPLSPTDYGTAAHGVPSGSGSESTSQLLDAFAVRLFGQQNNTVACSCVLAGKYLNIFSGIKIQANINAFNAEDGVTSYQMLVYGEARTDKGVNRFFDSVDDVERIWKPFEESYSDIKKDAINIAKKLLKGYFKTGQNKLMEFLISQIKNPDGINSASSSSISMPNPSMRNMTNIGGSGNIKNESEFINLLEALTMYDLFTKQLIRQFCLYNNEYRISKPVTTYNLNNAIFGGSGKKAKLDSSVLESQGAPASLFQSLSAMENVVGLKTRFNQEHLTVSLSVVNKLLDKYHTDMDRLFNKEKMKLDEVFPFFENPEDELLRACQVALDSLTGDVAYVIEGLTKSIVPENFMTECIYSTASVKVIVSFGQEALSRSSWMMQQTYEALRTSEDALCKKCVEEMTYSTILYYKRFLFYSVKTFLSSYCILTSRKPLMADSEISKEDVTVILTSLLKTLSETLTDCINKQDKDIEITKDGFRLILASQLYEYNKFTASTDVDILLSSSGYAIIGDCKSDVMMIPHNRSKLYSDILRLFSTPIVSSTDLLDKLTFQDTSSVGRSQPQLQDPSITSRLATDFFGLESSQNV